MKYIKFILATTVLFASSANADEFCVADVNFQSPKNLARTTDDILNPTHMGHVIGGEFPLLYNVQTKQKDHKGRDIRRYLFWTLNENFEFFGPFDLQQTSYPRFSSMGGHKFHYSDYSTYKLNDAVYDSATQSLFFKTTGPYIRGSNNTLASEKNLVEIPYGESPILHSSPQYESKNRKDFFKSMQWDETNNRLLLFNALSAREWQDGTPKMLYKGNFNSFIHLPKLDGMVGATYYGPPQFIPNGGEDPRKMLGYSRLMQHWGKWERLRETDDEGWYITHVGHNRGEAGGTYTTTFNLARRDDTLHIENETRLKPWSFLPWRGTGKTQVFSKTIGRVLFPDTGSVLRKGKKVRIKNWPGGTLKYIGDFTGEKLALFKLSDGSIYSYDGQTMRVLNNGVPPKGIFRNLPISGRGFFVNGRAGLTEVQKDGFNSFKNVHLDTLMSGRLVENAEGEVFSFSSKAIFQIPRDGDPKHVWSTKAEDLISGNHVRFTPAYISMWDSILFATEPREGLKNIPVGFDTINKYYRLSSCPQK